MAARAALRAPDRVKAHALALAPLKATILTGAAPIALPARSASVLFGVASSPFLGVLSLVSYEDVSAASRSEPFGSLDVLGLDTGEGALIVGLTCAIGMTAQGVSAFFLARSAYRGFDSAVGRAGNRGPSITPRPGEVERS